jgi:glucose-6-phosphate isomerase
MIDTKVNIATGKLTGGGVVNSRRTIGDLKNVFLHEAVRAAMDPGTVVYEVQSHEAVPQGTPGGLFFGTSNVMPGQVEGEYFMTKGHYHARRECAEYYWCIEGTGALILMDEKGKCWYEPMVPGTLHYIPGYVAHRLANTGNTPLRVGACWPSDAGYDYASISESGFTARLMNVEGKPTLVPCGKE